ncbi:MAG: hypothetical protein ACO25K_07600 [Candidatus Fonsibacter ubiquis]
MNTKIIQFFLIGLMFMVLSALTLTGDLQKYIHFSSGLNELVFCVGTAASGMLFMISSVIKDTKIN